MEFGSPRVLIMKYVPGCCTDLRLALSGSVTVTNGTTTLTSNKACSVTPTFLSGWLSVMVPYMLQWGRDHVITESRVSRRVQG